MLQLTKCIAVSSCIALLSACAFAPGMRVGDLPPSGTRITTDKGLNVQVETLTANNLPAAKESSVLSDAFPLFARKSYPVYRLAPGDVLEINLWANPEITPPTAVTAQGSIAGFLIDQDGYLAFPLVGRVKAEGETLASFSDKLQKRLAVYLKQPDATVKVIVYNGRKFNVDGEVRSPGQYSISNQPQTLYSALASAGGVLATGDINNLVLTRDGRNYHLGLLDLQLNNMSPNEVFLKEGDSIHVYAKENKKIYVMGEAGVPSALVVPEQGMSLANVIGEGKGLSPVAANSALVYVVRDDSKHNLTTIYHLDLSSIANIALAQRFKMQTNDLVYIDATGLARWSRVLDLVLPSAQGLANLGLVGYYTKQ
ncbi:MAG: polysaccharide biosynthesis/export family protein [Gammaproteobacteria bacterium]|nr:polysaccharide biosynthesis/export family protein [Gammaproteobacteria bacterium]